MNNNNQDITNEKVNVTKGGNRFKMQVTDIKDGYRQDVLVDTGSTISTMSRAAVKKLGLQEFACQEQIIRYGNTSTQVASRIPFGGAKPKRRSYSGYGLAGKGRYGSSSKVESSVQKSGAFK
ncbi:hypothetical protein G6F57_021891 [Rhizopus arrhizus]|uniref:Uncharacterized protein n=1 Tax=Rhizopus oryzae TaxID=64495 RepID=A0A9P6WT71_RHIOR|nr:hypothetical protein G6F30_014223 [Rhizopus arrhizus]KAG0971785.1 hypothetical protein G6F28_014203 [Rhizopus arrhizus]KAG0992859.1 hypothetical protein G6F27_014160 [Rhizopus arrhizus]KAG1003097.1 hypothetical protein G6F26_014139 [Rhizopus arrhizus]KAG1015505.1 hypothetical protein G6F25_014279 [Rhizopus arrhizus]